jgi:hypothetical protein
MFEMKGVEHYEKKMSICVFIFWGMTKLALLATCFMLVSCLAYSLTLKMEATCSSETSVDFKWTI